MEFGLPVLPIKVSFGRNTQLATLDATDVLAGDKKETAIVCLSAALLFTALAVISLARER